jgi:hypothetical protein
VDGTPAARPAFPVMSGRFPSYARPTDRIDLARSRMAAPFYFDEPSHVQCRCFGCVDGRRRCGRLHERLAERRSDTSTPT